ncbi:TetR/AcrR family transcriptional regulator [Arthrobacter sp. AL08]|uniref:TetR/AcrR family transcriptional regulator n=1 Tax=Micrococcaceae TaxID=1268 RepID=UPI00249C2BA8|nr:MULTISPECIES: TetR/AcrR family transcriptional regulator [Micrococcaceae]MDI3240830.1 TetR/AcrR family transcriptional regulator [Arthrobacter sp. AL05]MDI3277194.1 TetR/AcrR family transcriptional regulator [Arthrobacter sp. AL08]MDJ0352443.1 TetR/AcrR family transcriptional regulator [Pseudarthrobacter sp. PH31-O2]
MTTAERAAPANQPAERPDDDASREKVIAAAAVLFYARGFTAVGMDELRTESGVPLKRLYRLFPSKEAIVEEVLFAWERMWTSGVTAQVESTQVPRERLLAVYDFLASWFTSEGFRGCAFINSFGEVGGASGNITDIVRKQKKHFQDYLAELAEDLGAPASLAPQLAILAEGAITTAAIAASAEPARQARAAAEILIDVALRDTP